MMQSTMQEVQDHATLSQLEGGSQYIFEQFNEKAHKSQVARLDTLQSQQNGANPTDPNGISMNVSIYTTGSPKTGG